jgi:hypothetical protein
MRPVLSLLLSSVLIAQSGRPPAHASIQQVSWIAGTWSGGAGGATFEERWTPPAGGAMLAVSRSLKGDRMVAFEFLASSNAAAAWCTSRSEVGARPRISSSPS